LTGQDIEAAMLPQVLLTGITGFIGSHVAIALLERGYRVRGTLRDQNRADTIRYLISAALRADPGDRLTFARAELLSDQGWAEAVEGCEAVLHAASPFPTKPVSDPQVLIGPARDGTLRVLRAAAAAGVRRVVLTSSVAAIAYGHGGPIGRPFTEADWSQPEGPDIGAYEVSKTLAERAAWDFVAAGTAPFELVAINPSVVLGPVLDMDYGSSAEIVRKLLSGKFPGCPAIGWPIVDVRDVASLHVTALEHPDAAGERFICAGAFMTVAEIAALLKREMPGEAGRVPSQRLPDWAMRLAALFDRSARLVLHELGNRREVSTEKASRVLGWTARPAPDAVLATARSLVRLGIV